MRRAGNDCDGNTDEAPGPDGTPLCGPGKSCTKTADGCQCAGKCLSGEFPCPGGQKCEQVTLTETGDKALYCVPDLAALCGDCAKKTVKDGDDKILCAPAGTDPPGCTSTPVCACKGAAGCREPCHGVPCGEGKVCSSFGVHAGQCVEDNCYLTGCPGCGKLCNLGTCADNPCAPESCPEGQACKPESDFEGFDCLPSCGAVECEDGQECRDGECVPSCDPACKPGEICDLAGPKCVSDKCAARSECADGSCCDPFTGDCGNCPCEGVICPAGQQCELGQCHGQGPGTGGAGGGGGGSGGEPSCPLPAGGGGPGQGAVWRLPSGGGGCLCGLAPGRPLAPQGRLGGAALVALALALAARRRRAPLGALLLLAGGGLLGCKTEALCAGGCPDGGPAASSGTGTCGQAGSGATGEGGTLFVPDGGAGAGGGEAGGGGCEKTGETEKKCNGIDDDCDGEVDEDVDLHGKASCGSCENNCLALLANADPDTISCQWDGKSDSPGKCSFKKCAADYYDLDKDGQSCEYYCVKTADGDGSCNLKDDDCDGKTDEDADLCADADNCGKCGNKCAVVHGQGKCVDSGKKPCDVSNTHCAIASCNDDDKDGKPDWWDLDKSYATGCEYHCSPTNGGGEICGDGIDNDCDGKIDAADDLSKDPQMGQICYGDPDGLCSSFEHAGKKTCQGTKVVCVGSEVLVENQIPEKCNGVDDDCDGKIDDDPQDAGKACGKSNLFPCVLGSEQCQGGQLVCVGAIEPKAESCNGIDDDCDGKMDLAGNKPPADATGSCLEPKPPPPGATSPCKAGTKACVGGTVVCQGAVTAPLPSDACGEDSNCNGVLESQPDLKTDVHHCGSCPKDCYAGSKSSVWSCKQGTCAFEGCLPGYSDPYKKQTCEYPCVVNGAEQCNGVDDDCDGLVDANVQAPSPVKACGVSPGAARPECTGQVEVKCVGGGWQCKFPGGVCEPDCAKAVEICDGLDNDCDGAVNENVSNYGKSCASDDGLPPPGHGACRTTGTFVCDGSNKTKCSAVAKSCQDIPGGCEEKCDGVDNDCDGSVDEPFDAKGKVTAHFVRPAVTQIGQSVWIYSFEASRPGATDKSAGAGNGYRCSGGGCPPGIPPAPPFVTLDGTGACSVAGRLPWFNVTPVEVEQICEAAGGYACDLSDWQTACWTDKGCSWGYHPRGSDCQSAATGNKFCNLAAFDFDPNQPGTQHGLLPTASNKLAHCWADWAGLLGNGQNAGVSDITGNLREIVKTGQAAYALMGGAFDSMMEPSASCDFTFYAVDGTFQLFDSGFRCCFIKDPTQ
ncbi:MAG: hypothetical protein HY744_10540 [Deltaproteobacteria bacterium]|nr:hypothetical protein [Deltaproteobacteria bacterium]